MFETVVPETVKRRSRKVFYETLPVSIALHAIVIAAALIGAVWNVVFPTQSPRVIRAYSLTSIPEPPPPPPPPPPPQPHVAPAAKVNLPPPPLQIAHLDLAPTVIPDLVPKVEPPPPAPPPPPAVPQPISAPVETSTAGASDGVAGGQVGGQKHGTVGGIVFAEDGRVHIDKHEKLPLKVLEQEFPRYPDGARKKQLEARVLVRYTIGKNGRVIDTAIIEHGVEPMFDDETLTVVRKWRFRPLTVNGAPVEVVHEVEFFYQFTAH
jgi:TonB family protein